MPVEYNFSSMPGTSLRSMMGELQADALGISAVYDANFPVSYFGQSMNRLNQFLTQRGSGIASQGLPYAQAGQQRQIPDWRIDPRTLPPMPPPATEGENEMLRRRFPIDDFPGAGEADDDALAPLRKMNPFLLEGGLFEWSEDTKIFLYLLVIAIILIAAGVFSLR